MNVIDIRDTDEVEIEKIIYGDDVYIRPYCDDYDYIAVYDEDHDGITIRKGDINNLIKALEKAKELWGN